SDGPVAALIGRDPAPARAPEVLQHVQRGWFVVGDVRHADLAERGTGSPFDVPEGRQFAGAGGTDTHLLSIGHLRQARRPVSHGPSASSASAGPFSGCGVPEGSSRNSGTVSLSARSRAASEKPAREKCRQV